MVNFQLLHSTIVSALTKDLMVPKKQLSAQKKIDKAFISINKEVNKCMELQKSLLLRDSNVILIARIVQRDYRDT